MATRRIKDLSPEQIAHQREKSRQYQAAFKAKNRDKAEFREKNRIAAVIYRQKLRAIAEKIADHGKVMRAALRSDDLYAAADRVVPRKLPSFVREDVVSDLCLGVLDGSFTIEDMPQQVTGLVQRHRGQSSKFSEPSIDDPVGRTGITLGQQLGLY